MSNTAAGAPAARETAPAREAPRGVDSPSAKELLSRLGEDVLGANADHGLFTVDVSAERNLEALSALKDDLGYEFFIDLFGMDRTGLGKQPLGARFCVAYHLRRPKDGARVVLRAFLPEGSETLRSAHGLFKGALWTEREAHEMFGMDFAGSPDQRRLLTPSDFEGFPLRKDFPLRGVGYREDFPRYEGYTPPWQDFPGQELPRAQREGRLRDLTKDEFAPDRDA